MDRENSKQIAHGRVEYAEEMRKARTKKINLASVEELLLIDCTWSEVCAALDTDTRTIAEAVREKYGETLKEYQLRYRRKSWELILKNLRKHAKTDKRAAKFLRSINVDLMEDVWTNLRK